MMVEGDGGDGGGGGHTAMCLYCVDYANKRRKDLRTENMSLVLW